MRYQWTALLIAQAAIAAPLCADEPPALIEHVDRTRASSTPDVAGSAEKFPRLIPSDWFHWGGGVLLPEPDPKPVYWATVPGLTIDKDAREVVRISPNVFYAGGRIYSKTSDDDPLSLLIIETKVPVFDEDGKYLCHQRV